MPTINYRKKDGTPVSGVTSIMGAVLNKPALLYWAYTQGLENYDRITKSVLSICGNTPGDSYASGLAKKIQGVMGDFQVGKLYDKRDKAAEAGTLGHAFVEHELKGLPEPDLTGLSKDIISRAEGCHLAFLEWRDRTKFKLIHSEIALVSEVHGFGGCLDIGGGVTDLELIDLKTGKGIYQNYYIQLGGYGILWDETHPDNPIRGYNILNIHPDGSFTHDRKQSIPEFKEIFLHTNKIYQIMKNSGIKL
jgi:hypothetical protein